MTMAGFCLLLLAAYVTAAEHADDDYYDPAPGCRAA
jgi:hypothetical protein